MRGGRRRSNEVESLAEAFTELRADYNAAKTGRYRRRRIGVAATGSGADFHYRSEADYLRMMEIARDMDRNDSVVGQMIDRAVTNAVQDGVNLDPQTGDKNLDADLVARWNDWATDPDQCDLAGELTFADMEWLALRHVFVDGDMVALPNRDGPLQLVEGHRLRTPRNTKRNVVHGVLLDKYRKRQEYWLTKTEVDPNKPVERVGDMQAYPVRDADGNRQVFHVYNPKRASQTRGVTALAPIFDTLGQFEDIAFAKLVQQQIVSCFAIFRMREVGFRGAGGGQIGQQETEVLADGSTRTVEGIAPGMEITGEPGERLEGFSPNVPNPEFLPHMRMVLQLIGVNVGLPLVLVLLDASETNFSGWRGAIDQARLGFRRNQRWLIARFHRPSYRWKLRQWIAGDPALRRAAETSKVKLFAHRWNPPTWPYIEPLKDASADLLRVRNGLISPRRLHAERGRDWQEIAGEIVEDNALAIRAAREAAQELNREIDDGQAVHWRELLSLPTPDGVRVELQAGGKVGDENGA